MARSRQGVIPVANLKTFRLKDRGQGPCIRPRNYDGGLTVKCPICSQPVSPSTRGRPRIYCSTACRSRAHARTRPARRARQYGDRRTVDEILAEASRSTDAVLEEWSAVTDEDVANILRPLEPGDLKPWPAPGEVVEAWPGEGVVLEEWNGEPWEPEA